MACSQGIAPPSPLAVRWTEPAADCGTRPSGHRPSVSGWPFGSDPQKFLRCVYAPGVGSPAPDRPRTDPRKSNRPGTWRVGDPLALGRQASAVRPHAGLSGRAPTCQRRAGRRATGGATAVHARHRACTVESTPERQNSDAGRLGLPAGIRSSRTADAGGRMPRRGPTLAPQPRSGMSAGIQPSNQVAAPRAFLGPARAGQVAALGGQRRQPAETAAAGNSHHHGRGFG